MRVRKGFTLIELLVVIAIIGILASMVFPVFARARESARKAVCLSNVKNIALAIQMYLADNNDTFCTMARQGEEAEAAFVAMSPKGRSSCTGRPKAANPYLRFHVILDEYIKNRDVWRCPSAKLPGYAALIVNPHMYGGWLNAWIVNEPLWTSNRGTFGPCVWAYPPGWGGEVTDSFGQERIAGPSAGGRADAALGAFEMGIAINGSAADLKLAAVEDTVHYIICGEGGPQSYNQTNMSNWAWTDICQVDCALNCSHDWELCAPTAADCGLYTFAPNNGAFHTNPEFRKQYARHLGGSNLGFLDGHAAWWPSERILSDWKASIVDGTGDLDFGDNNRWSHACLCPLEDGSYETSCPPGMFF